MRDSDTYMAILDEGREAGRIEELRKMIIRLGKKHFGSPDEIVVAAIAAVNDPERLENLLERMSDIESWQELLANSSVDTHINPD